jgi:hypothetical protein
MLDHCARSTTGVWQAFNQNAEVGHFVSQATLAHESSSRAPIFSARAKLFIHDWGWL